MKNLPNIPNAVGSGKEEIVYPRPDDEIVYPSLEPLTVNSSDAPPWIISNICELSQNSRTIHTVYVGFLVYCAVTIVTSEDRKLVINSKAHLPVVNLDVPLSSFVIIAPIVAIIAFIYFQLHVQALKASISILKTKYAPTERERLYPWMINMAEDPEPGLLGIIQQIIAKTSMWLLLPAVLFMFEYFTLKKHDPVLASAGWLILLMGVSLTFWLWYRYEDVPFDVELSSRKVFAFDKARKIIIYHVGKFVFAAISTIFLVFLLIMISNKNKALLGLFTVNLSGQIISAQQKEEGDVNRVDLHGLHLEGANLAETNFRSVNLNGADLSHANLNCSDLSDTDLNGASLQGAFLMNARLQKTRITAKELVNVVTLYNAKLDDDLDQELRSTNPELFREPLTAGGDAIFVGINDSDNPLREKSYDEKRFISDVTVTARKGQLLRNDSFLLSMAKGSYPIVFAVEIWKQTTTISKNGVQVETKEIVYAQQVGEGVIVPCHGKELPPPRPLFAGFGALKRSGYYSLMLALISLLDFHSIVPSI